MFLIVLCPTIAFPNSNNDLNENIENALHYLQRGVEHHKSGNYEEALTAYSKAVKLNPNDERAYIGLGFVSSTLEKHNEALKAYKQALALNPDSEWAHAGIGIVYGKLGKYKQAVDSYLDSIRINPESAETYYNLGVAYGKLNKTKDSIKSYKQSIKLKPDYKKAHDGLANANKNLNKNKIISIMNSFSISTDTILLIFGILVFIIAIVLPAWSVISEQEFGWRKWAWFLVVIGIFLIVPLFCSHPPGFQGGF